LRQFILQLPLSRLPWRIIVSLAGRHIRCYNKGKEDDSLQQDENSSDKRPTLYQNPVYDQHAKRLLAQRVIYTKSLRSEVACHATSANSLLSLW